MASWQSLSNQVYTRLSEMDTATSQANAAAGEANTAAVTANGAANTAAEAAEAASAAAAQALDMAKKWDAAQAAVVETLEPSEGAMNSVTLESLEDRKQFNFKLVRGERGRDGAQGAPGQSGVHFALSGNALYITTT